MGLCFLALLCIVALVVVVARMGDNGNDSGAAEEKSSEIEAIHGTGKVKLYPGRPIKYSEMFRDNQPRHLAAAEAIGLKSRPHSRKEVESLQRQLREVKSNDNYVIDDLTHSVPYLVPKAADELNRIGKEFAEILSRNGMPHYRFRVTSILRTDEDIAKLQKSGNINSVTNSAHCYGTTFDIAYTHFDKHARTRDYTPDDNLKLVLGQVLLNEQRAGRIYIKYEWKQGCFHITVRENN